MQFTQKAILLGVVGKKGSGKLDNGQSWETDRVELHCLQPFDQSDSMAHGSTVIVYQVDDYVKNYQPAKAMIDQQVDLKMQMIPAKKLGQAPRIICSGFSLSSVQADSVSPSPAEPAKSALPEGIKASK